MDKKHHARCTRCSIPVKERSCLNPDGKGGLACPTLLRKDLINQSLACYEDDRVKAFARQASIQEGACYEGRDEKPAMPHPVKTRIQETCEFALKMGYRRLGLVYCAGLAKEGALVDEILEAQGFEVVSVWCKVGSVPKEFIGIEDGEKVRPGTYESMCNPILQAKIVNEEKTDFNILLGLCVGHDSLFFKYAEAPTTVLAVKDRVSGHNPLGPLYTSASYYRRLTRKGF